MTIYHGYDFSKFDYKDTERYREFVRLQEQAAREARSARCICIWQPGDNARCPVHGITREK